MCFCYLNHHFVIAVKLLGKLFLMCDSIWITKRECFPTVLVCWIQISNHFFFFLSGRSSNIKQYVFLLCEPAFCGMLQCCMVCYSIAWCAEVGFSLWRHCYSCHCTFVLVPWHCSLCLFCVLAYCVLEENYRLRRFV